jgi:hypothetical protein
MERAQTNLQLYRRLIALGHDEPELQSVARAYELAITLFADNYRGSRKPFVCHLVGTAALVAEERPRFDVVTASAIHAAYEHATWPDGRPASSPEHRDGVRTAIGSVAEQLVFDYTQLPWDEQIIFELPGRVDAMDERTRQLILMRIANAADEIADLGLRLSTKGTEPRYQPECIDALEAAAGRLGHRHLAAFVRAACTESEQTQVPASLRSRVAHSGPVTRSQA